MEGEHTHNAALVLLRAAARTHHTPGQSQVAAWREAIEAASLAAPLAQVTRRLVSTAAGLALGTGLEHHELPSGHCGPPAEGQ